MGVMQFALFNLLALFFCTGPVTASGSYVLTIPRRWTTEGPTQVCVVLTEGSFVEGDSLTVSVAELEKGKRKLSSTSLQFSPGLSNNCQSLTVPSTEDFNVNVDVTGTVAGNSISDNVNVTMVQNYQRTFIQTDKYLYKPGQQVQFRILTVKGPHLKVAIDSYEEVYVHSPTGSRIQQWRNVDNSAGLVHLSFDLSDEVEEGVYSIFAKRFNKSPEEKTFKVEDYVLPRYEVTIVAPKNILGSDASVTIKLCAKYTFGEPVEGNATLSLAAGSWQIYENLTESKPISGCQNFTFETNKLRFDENNCHIRISNLIAYGVVVESGTGVELHGKKDDITVHRQAIQFNDVSATAVAKPYLPNSVKIATKYPNGEPAAGEIMEVCTTFEEEKFCKNITTNDKGFLNFAMPSQESTRAEIQAVKYPRIEKNWNDVMEASQFYKYRYYSQKYLDPLNSSLTIFTGEKIQCTTGQNIDVQIPVVYITSSNQGLTNVFVQVISRGQVKYLDKVEVNFEKSQLPLQDHELLLPLEKVPEGLVRGTFNIPLNLPATVAPNLKILVWYKSKSGVVVADSTELNVGSCLPHKVDLSWSKKKGEPGSQTDLHIKGAQNALCSIGVVDKSVELLSSDNNDFNIKSLLGLPYESDVSRWDTNQLNLDYCLRKYNDSHTRGSAMTTRQGSFRVSPFPGNSELEAIHMFNKAGYYVLSNVVLETQFCDKLITQALKEEASQKGIIDSVGESDVVMRKKVSAISFDAPPVHFSGDTTVLEEFAPANKEAVGDEAQERSYLPETWLWLLQPLSPTGESTNSVKLPDTITEWVGRAVCVHPSEGVGISAAATIRTFTPFFVDLTLPAVVTRGEILPLKVSIFNYLDEDIPVKLTLAESTDYVYVSEEGNLETGTRQVCIPAKGKSVQTIRMKFVALGNVNITVEAHTEALPAGECGTGTPPAKRDKFIRSLPVEAEGFLRENVYTNYICSQDEATFGKTNEWHVAPPSGIVEGSARAWITATGDLMGPTVDNLGSLVKMPSGCGEQNMVNFAPNIYILQYLDASNQTTEFIKEKITRLLNQGYQRQLLFRHNDGGFSAFGEKDASASTWLTAFVVKSFAQAKPYTQIDEAMLSESISWLTAVQDTNGCFESKGRLITKTIEGGIDGSENSKPLLTAYVLAALLEANRNISKEQISSAVSCIQKDTSSHPYNQGLKGYALALAKSPDAKTIIDQLVAVAVSNSSDMRWDTSDGAGKNSALNVETAAYALLAMVAEGSNDYKGSAKKVVRWLSGQRNGQGGFVSTQDTVVALQALAAFEKSQPSPILDMTIKATADTFDHLFLVSEDKKFLQQRVDLSTLPADVKLTPGGQGCAVIQGVLRYNVLADSPSAAFTLKLDVSASSDEGCKTYNISSCVNYNLPDGKSNMALLQVKLVSGYVPLKQDLKDVISAGANNFKRYEVDGRTVTFYIDEVNATQICASFRARQEVEIEQPKPGTVLIFDYYQPEFVTTEKFSFTADPTCQS